MTLGVKDQLSLSPSSISHDDHHAISSALLVVIPFSTSSCSSNTLTSSPSWPLLLLTGFTFTVLSFGLLSIHKEFTSHVLSTHRNTPSSPRFIIKGQQHHHQEGSMWNLQKELLPLFRFFLFLSWSSSAASSKFASLASWLSSIINDEPHEPSFHSWFISKLANGSYIILQHSHDFRIRGFSLSLWFPFSIFVIRILSCPSSLISLSRPLLLLLFFMLFFSHPQVYYSFKTMICVFPSGILGLTWNQGLNRGEMKIERTGNLNPSFSLSLDRDYDYLKRRACINSRWLPPIRRTPPPFLLNIFLYKNESNPWFLLQGERKSDDELKSSETQAIMWSWRWGKMSWIPCNWLNCNFTSVSDLIKLSTPLEFHGIGVVEKRIQSHHHQERGDDFHYREQKKKKKNPFRVIHRNYYVKVTCFTLSSSRALCKFIM